MEGIRFLTEEEMLLVAGGYGDDAIEEIVVTAKQDARDSFFTQNPFEDPNNYRDNAACYLNKNPGGENSWTCQAWDDQGKDFHIYNTVNDQSHTSPLL